jgi:LPXTG-motif cell wall-anchored protein
MGRVQVGQQGVRRTAAVVAVLVATVVALGATGQAAASTIYRTQVDDPSCSGNEWPSLRAGAAALDDPCSSDVGDTTSTTPSTLAPATSQVTTATTVRATSTTLPATSELPPASVLGATTVVAGSETSTTTAPSATVLGESESRSTGSTAGELAETGRTTGPLTLAGAALVLGGALLLALRARRSARPASYSSIV